MSIVFDYLSPEFELVKGSPGSAGWDIKSESSLILSPGERQIIPTGVTLSRCPSDCYLRIAPRSGLAFKYGIDVFAGVVDSDYKGKIQVILFNAGDESFGIKRGDRIAQLIPTNLATYHVNGHSQECERGRGGFGSTFHDCLSYYQK